MLSGRGLDVGPIPRLEESYQMWCVTVCDLETSRIKSFKGLTKKLRYKSPNFSFRSLSKELKNADKALECSEVRRT